ncbi:hypothetical protein [Halolamina sp.]|jgi:hypothetical protein
MSDLAGLTALFPESGPDCGRRTPDSGSLRERDDEPHPETGP